MTGCINSPLSRRSNGYPQKNAGRGRGLTTHHRWVYEQAHGELPEDIHVHHLCGNILCINIDHLEAIDRARHTRMHSACRVHGEKEKKWRPYRNGGKGSWECQACARIAARRRRGNPP